MWMKSLVCLLSIILLSLSPASLNRSGITLCVVLSVQADAFTADPFGNLYVIRGNTLRKFSEKGIILSEFTDPSVLHFSSADASDPFKILLFSKESAEIKRVDNELTQQGSTLQLNNLGLFSPWFACNSYENGCWIFDQMLFELVRINHLGTIDQRTGSLLSFSENPVTIREIFEHDLYLYAVIENYGLWKFDRYGNLAGKIPLPDGFGACWISNQKIIFNQNGNLVIFNPARNMEKTAELPIKNYSAIRIISNKLLMYIPDTLSVYNLKTLL